MQLSITNNPFDCRNFEEKNSIETLNKDSLRTEKDSVQNYDTSKLKKKVEDKLRAELSREIDLRDTLIDSFKEGKDSIRLFFSKYSDYRSKILNKNLAETQTKKELNSLEKSYHHAIDVFSDFVHSEISFSGYRKESKNSLSIVDMGLNMELKDQIQADLKGMFDTAKKYYDSNGSLKGITNKLISKNSSTFSYSDVLSLYKNLDKMKSITKSLYANDNPKLISDYLKGKIESLNSTDPSKGLFLDIFS